MDHVGALLAAVGDAAPAAVEAGSLIPESTKEALNRFTRCNSWKQRANDLEHMFCSRPPS